MRNAKAALKKHCLLFLNEITGASLFSHLTFGLLEGWWAYEDPELRVPGCPALTAENWQVVLSSEGFGAIYHPTRVVNVQEADQQVIVAESDGVVRQQLLTDPGRENGQQAHTMLTDPDPGRESGQQAHTMLTDKLQEALKQTVFRLLRVQVEKIDSRTLLSEYGFDSITFMEFANHLNQTYQLNLTPPLFYEHSTIERLAQYLQETYPAALAPYFVEASSHVGMQKDSTSVVPRLALDETDKVLPIGESPMVNGRHSRSGSSLMPTPEQQAQAGREAIAIIGLSGAFPQAPDVQSLWRNLLVGRDCISEIPASRWDWRAYFGDPATPNLNKTNIKWAGVIEDVELFDPLFFGISPSEAEQMDPQQRLLMMYVWKAIEDAGYSAESLSGTNTALFVGTASSGYSERIFRANMAIEGHTSTGLAASVGPNRMSYFLNLHGPSEPIETACSSSLVALHRGVNAIESGQCNMVIAGGVNTLISPEGHISLSKAGMLSLDGRCKTFSAQANGFVRSEGVGMLVLKKLSDAEQAGDHIYAVIRATAENHGGRANSLTAPNPRAQADLLIAAYRKAAIDPRTVGYIEVHGTGTELGDPIEINGLKAAFSELMHTGVSGQKQATTHASPSGSDGPIPIATCGIGTVKSNIGHLELAAGVAGVIKVLLQMQHKTLVKSLHCEQINPYIGFEGSPFYIVQENREWEALRDNAGNILPRRAGVSSFGFGGVNAHVVLEEYIPCEQARASIVINSQKPVPIVLSAKNQERLKKRVEDLLVAIREYRFSDHDLADIAYTLQVGRDEMEQRLALLVGSMRELKEKLQSFVKGQHNIIGLYQGQIKHNKEIIDIFGTDEGLQGVVEGWIEQQKYAKLLDLWEYGLMLDWNTLYRDTKPRRVSLPTYPFAKERYWCDHRVIREETGSCRLPAEEVYTPNPNPSSGNALGTLMLKPSWREETILYEEASPPHYEKHVVILCELGEDSKASIISQMRGVDCLILQSDQQEIDKKFLTYVIQVFEGIKNLIANNLRKMALIQIVVPYHEEQQLLSGLSGLLASAQREYPRLVGQLIELAAYTQDLAEILLENSRCPSSQKIR